MSDKPLEPLDDDQVEKIAGGYIFNASVLSGDYHNPWEVLDSKGNVVERYGDRRPAEMLAQGLGESTAELTWHQVQKLRETGSPY